MEKGYVLNACNGHVGTHACREHSIRLELGSGINRLLHQRFHSIQPPIKRMATCDPLACIASHAHHPLRIVPQHVNCFCHAPVITRLDQYAGLTIDEIFAQTRRRVAMTGLPVAWAA